MDGYHRLSCAIAHYPELAIFRRFRTLHVYNVLVRQAELVNLGWEFGDIIRDDRKLNFDPKIGPLDESIEHLQGYRPNGKPSRQWTYSVELHTKLKEYNEALSLLESINRRTPVRQLNLHGLRAWLNDINGGHEFLRSFEQFTWDDDADLTSVLDSGENNDAISRWIHDTFIPWIHRTIWHRFKPHELPLHEPYLSKQTVMVPLDIYPDSKITDVVNGISTVLSPLLPSLSIFLLYYVHSDVARLSIILALSLMFSIAMSLIAKGRRPEHFAATAAFSAVLVVFVGSTITPVGTSPNSTNS